MREIAGQARDDGVEVGLCTSETGSPTLVRIGRGGMAKMRPFDRLRDLQAGNAYP